LETRELMLVAAYALKQYHQLMWYAASRHLLLHAEVWQVLCMLQASIHCCVLESASCCG
jgi:hypothetical protein